MFLTSAAAADPPAEIAANSTLDDCLHYAAANNPALRAAHERWRAAEAKIPQATALPDPRLSFARYLRSVETRVGPQEHRIGLSQTIPWFGKRALRGDVAGREARALFHDLEAERLRLERRVRADWIELYHLQRSIEVTEANIRLLKDLEAVAQTRVRGGQGLAGVSKAHFELGKLEDRRRTLKELRKPLEARLNAALNRPVNAVLPRPKDLKRGAGDFDDARMAARLLESNPQLKALELRRGAAEKAEDLARRNRYPDVTVGIDYIQTGGAIGVGLPDSGKDAALAAFSINLPLSRRKYDAAIRSAKSTAEAGAAMHRERANLLQADLKMALHRFRDAERKVELYRDTLAPLAEQSLNVAKQAWEAGRTDFLTVIDAERQLLELQLQFERARADRELGIADVEMLVGRGASVVEAPANLD